MAARKAADEVVGAKQSDTPNATKLDTDPNGPATNAPGDAPHDTTDPSEQASTITPQLPNNAALAAGTIVGALPVSSPPGVPEVDDKDVRVDEYDAVKPDGTASAAWPPSSSAIAAWKSATVGTPCKP